MEIILRKQAKKEKLTRYFTGKQCKNGHVAERFTSTGKCSECSKGWCKDYSSRNTEKEKERGRRYRADNHSEILAKEKEYRDKNKDLVNARCRASAKKNILCRFTSDTCSRIGIRSKGVTKSLSYNQDEFKRRIESTFEPWMSWENYGEWEIDHIISVGELVSSGCRDIHKINALENIRALSSKENHRRKKVRYKNLV